MIRLSCVQMTSTNDVVENLAKIKSLLKNQEMDVLVLPEMCLAIGNKYKKPLTISFEQSINELSELAKSNNTILIAGTIKQPQTGQCKNLAGCFVFDSLGAEIANYQKIHLFDANVNDKQGAYRESDHYESGTTPVVFDVCLNKQVLKIGIAICYDLRFSLLFHELKKRGAQLIVVPAAFVYETGKAHWEVLLKARAIEFGVYIFACNQTGWHDKSRQTFGHSMLINPWGDVVDSLDEQEAILNCQLETSELVNPKKILSSFNHTIEF
ncbi:MAG: carbon-nitrogen hydrolase family protein [Saccharospirillaceae bacterium]|nr:carbon-nitrogen hydrolase family protein [Pseudomonadales bacterium]NRB79853.1 carbon-nitrogen hydrolase family protein [Saccharospirillaceae bacterium]